MVFRKLFLRVLTACVALGIASATSLAQTSAARTPAPITGDANEIACDPDDPATFSAAPGFDQRIAKASVTAANLKPIQAVATIQPTAATLASLALTRFQPLLMAAIDQRLGARYSWGATGPNRYDCSGFVWSIFQSAGINFERGSARQLFARLEPAKPEDQYKFGTLVFFRRLSHVGVVVDQKGFYHASRHHGVVYSPFNDYWLSKIDGFRRVPLPPTTTTD
ncbi:MAG TPA: C40 family peptidase [Pyrinomonadaceae bacterium]|nr:C40 family peptidase [Pyrinomonadaceae bacterium]